MRPCVGWASMFQCLGLPMQLREGSRTDAGTIASVFQGTARNVQANRQQFLHS